MCTSGRGVDLVVGVAGSGKTTALAAARDAFEAAGYEVIGTSTSGQAARTLGREAGIDSRTLASLNWRIAHDTLRLSPRHVAVLDEAAMTDDAALVAFLEAARVTGAKVVAVGDPRQLSSVGPGGGFEAVVRRFGGAVHVLSENVRQVDHAERAALSQLRSGKVDEAVAWYAGAGRIAVSPDRDTALDATVAGWAADVAKGAQTAMYAWRRANVAELNRRGRQAWEKLGRLSGPELVVGATGYRAGDRIVTLAPGAGGEIVTSECGTVLAVDVERRRAGRHHGRRAPPALRPRGARRRPPGPRLRHHRPPLPGRDGGPGPCLEDGGGRELAYVKMSRARERSTVYAVADSVEQAVEDLGRAWSPSRRIGWAIDQGTPAPGIGGRARPRTPPPCRPACVTPGWWPSGRRWPRWSRPTPAPPTTGPATPWSAWSASFADLDKAEGWGEWRGTPLGEAAIAWSGAVQERRACLAQAEHVGLRERHRLRQRAAKAAERVGPLRERFEALAGPERARLKVELPEAKRNLADLQGRRNAYMRFQHEHPEALRRLDRLDEQIATAAWELDLERQELDGIRPEPPQQSAQQWVIERGIRGMDRGLDLGIDL